MTNTYIKICGNYENLHRMKNVKGKLCIMETRIFNISFYAYANDFIIESAC